MIFLLALFIAFSKRRDDIINRNESGRGSLDGYNISFVNTSISVLVPIIIVSYLLYCTSDENIIRVGENLYITTLFVIPAMSVVTKQIAKIINRVFVNCSKNIGSSNKTIIDSIFLLTPRMKNFIIRENLIMTHYYKLLASTYGFD